VMAPTATGAVMRWRRARGLARDLGHSTFIAVSTDVTGGGLMRVARTAIFLAGGLVAASCGNQAPPTPEEKLGVWSWWTSGGEQAALKSLFEVFSKKYPQVSIENATESCPGGTC